MLKNYLARLCVSSLSLSLSLSSFGFTELYPEKKSCIVHLFSNSQLCSGYYIGDDLLVTAAHCVAGLWDVEYSMNNRGDYFPAEVIAINKDADLALLSISNPLDLKACELLANEERVNVGDDVYSIGHPGAIARSFLGFWSGEKPTEDDLTYVLVKGIISKKVKHYFYSDLAISSGFSGGPVFNEQGTVVGTNSALFRSSKLGIIADHQETHKMIDEQKSSNSQREPLPFYKASGRTSLSYLIADQIFEHKGVEDSVHVFGRGVEFGLHIWDRLTFYYGYLNFEQEKGSAHISSIGFRHNFQLGQLTTIGLNPLLNYKSFEYLEGDYLARYVSLRIWIDHVMHIEIPFYGKLESDGPEYKGSLVAGFDLFALIR